VKRIYLDNNSTTAVHPCVLEAMLPYFVEKHANPSSLHASAQEAKAAVETARAQVARLIGASAEEIFFTGSGTEADNLALIGGATANAGRGRHIITSAIEHKAVLEPCKVLESSGFRVTRVGVDSSGVLKMDELKQAISDETIMIAVMAANNEVGTIQPFQEIGVLARERDILFFTDAVQAAGKVQLNVQKIGASLVALSSHKMYGPKGVGCLYIRKGCRVNPIIHGGAHEKGKRAGTENVPGIVGFGAAARLMADLGEAELETLRFLRDKLETGLIDRVEDITVNGRGADRVPNTSNMSFSLVEGESLVLSLDMEGVSASTGSACTSGAQGPSHVLAAMGIPADLAQGSLRFSLGLLNTDEEVDTVLEIVPRVVERLRSMSPLVRKGGN
jgi:cysteine desulfurase